MKPDLADLRITEPEIERLSGFDVGDIFIGGVFGGVWRSSIWRHPKRRWLFYITELLVAGLIYIFSLPIGLVILQNTTQDAYAISNNLKFLIVTLGVTLMVMVVWNVYMHQQAKKLTTLMHLLDEVDRYHQVLQAVDILDQLETIGHPPANLSDRANALQALYMTRSSLIAGLMTEKIFRDNQRLLSRRYELLSNIENNVVALKSLEVNHQADEYRDLINEALQIGITVQKELSDSGCDRP
jgi:hypothetical protein